MTEDEAAFGRINVPKYCWCPPGVRPSVPCQRVRQYVNAYGAADPLSGDSFFLILPSNNTHCMSLFLERLGQEYADDIILLLCDGASWHTSHDLNVPDNIVLFQIPPHTPEMNPMEQIRKELRGRGFRNELFNSLEAVVDRLSETICSLDNFTVSHITLRHWIRALFL